MSAAVPAVKDALNAPTEVVYRQDNLKVLRRIASDSIDLVATDPPYNTLEEFKRGKGRCKNSGFLDMWRWDEEMEGEEALEALNPFPGLRDFIFASKATNSDAMGAYLFNMSLRLMEIHRVLKPTGSLVLQCDPTASAYLKVLLDCIFGHSCAARGPAEERFRNEIIWGYAPAGKSPSYGVRRKHDTLLFYSKGGAPYFEQPLVPMTKKQIACFSKTDADGRKYKQCAGGRTYLDSKPTIDGKPAAELPSWWSDIPSRQTAPASADFVTDYPTEKPMKLYDRVVRMACPPGGVVLDPYCGGGTTLIAATRSGRRFIGVDLWTDQPDDEIEDRLGILSDEAGCRVRQISRRLPVRDLDDQAPPGPSIYTKSKRERKFRKRINLKPFKELLLKRQDGGIYCNGCLRDFDLEEDLVVDHDTPLSRGGTNDVGNLTLLCGPCNNLKADKHFLDGLWQLLKALGRTNDQLPGREKTPKDRIKAVRARYRERKRP